MHKTFEGYEYICNIFKFSMHLGFKSGFNHFYCPNQNGSNKNMHWFLAKDYLFLYNCALLNSDLPNRTDITNCITKCRHIDWQNTRYNQKYRVLPLLPCNIQRKETKRDSLKLEQIDISVWHLFPLRGHASFDRKREALSVRPFKQIQISTQ